MQLFEEYKLASPSSLKMHRICLILWWSTWTWLRSSSTQTNTFRPWTSKYYQSHKEMKILVKVVNGFVWTQKSQVEFDQAMTLKEFLERHDRWIDQAFRPSRQTKKKWPRLWSSKDWPIRTETQSVALTEHSSSRMLTRTCIAQLHPKEQARRFLAQQTHTRFWLCTRQNHWRFRSINSLERR